MKITMKREITTEYAGGWKNIKYVGLPVGAEVTEILKDGTEVTFEVAAVNVYGAKMALVCKNCLPEEHRMNDDWTNAGGWPECKMRKVTMQKILELLPDDLLEAIQPRTIRQQLRGETVTSEDKIWLPSLMEITGKDYGLGVDLDDVHFPLYQTERDRVKELGDTGETDWYWLRSPYPSGDSFMCVGASGSSSVNFASLAFGVAFGFLL